MRIFVVCGEVCCELLAPKGGYMSLQIGDVVDRRHEEDEWGYGTVLSGSKPDNKGWYLLSAT